MTEIVHCPRCRAEVYEKTLVEPNGAWEVEDPVHAPVLIDRPNQPGLDRDPSVDQPAKKI